MRASILWLFIAAQPALTQPSRVDALGDPLPAGAIVRLGTVRYRIGSVASFALSPDGKTLAVETANQLVLWDIDSGKPVLRVPFVRTGYFDERIKNRLVFASDGKSIVHLDNESMRGYDAKTGRQLFKTEAPKGGASLFRVRNSSNFVVVDGNQKAFMLDASGRPVEGVEFGERPNEALLPIGRYFLWMNHERHALIDAKTGKVHIAGYDHAVLSPDERWLYAIGSNGNQARLQTFDVGTGKKVEELERPAGWDQYVAQTRLALSANGTLLYAWRDGQPTQRRDLKAGNWLDPLPTMGKGHPIMLPDGKRVAFISPDGILRRYDLAMGKEIVPSDGFESSMLATASPDGRFITTSSNGRLDQHESNGKLLWSLRSNRDRLDGGPRDCAWSPDSQSLALISPTQITLREPRSAKVLWSLSFSDVVKTPETVRVESFQPPIAFTMAGDRLTVAFDFSYGGGQPLAVIDPRFGKPIGIHRLGETSQLAMPTRGRTEVAEASYYLPGIDFVDLATGLKRSFVAKKDENWNTHEHGVRTAFSPDGDYLLIWNRGGVAVLRNPVSGKFIRKFKVNQLDVEASAFSPDGLWLATGGANGLVALWDVTTGDQVWGRGGHPEMVNRVSFAGRRQLVSSSRDLTALVWDLRPDEPLKKQPWEALSGDNPRLAYMAVWALADDPASPALLRSKIGPAPPASGAQIQQWIADIGSPRYAIRESASAALRDLGRLVEPELRALRAKTSDAEVRTRLDGLLDKLSPTRTAIEIVHARAVAAMEIAGTAEAKKLLAEWASGGAGSRLTIDAKAALGRMSR